MRNWVMSFLRGVGSVIDICPRMPPRPKKTAKEALMKGDWENVGRHFESVIGPWRKK